MKKVIRIVAMLLVIVTVCGTAAVPASAWWATKSYSTITGKLTNYTTQSLHVYTDGKAAKLRICTFDQAGNRASGKVIVIYESDNGGRWSKVITGNPINGTTNLTLPKGNTHYKITIYRANTTNSNLSKTYYYSIDFKSSWHAWHY